MAAATMQQVDVSSQIVELGQLARQKREEAMGLLQQAQAADAESKEAFRQIQEVAGQAATQEMNIGNLVQFNNGTATRSGYVPKKGNAAPRGRAANPNNKSQAIRDAISANPNMGPKDIAAMLQKQGFNVNAQYVSTIKSNSKAKGGVAPKAVRSNATKSNAAPRGRAAGPNNKSQAIRDAVAANPNMGPKDIAAMLQKQGFNVNAQYVSTIKSNSKAKGGAAPKAARGNATSKKGAANANSKRNFSNEKSIGRVVFDVVSRRAAYYKNILPDLPSNAVGLKISEIKEIIEGQKLYKSNSKNFSSMVQGALHKLTNEQKLLIRGEGEQNGRYTAVDGAKWPE